MLCRSFLPLRRSDVTPRFDDWIEECECLSILKHLIVVFHSPKYCFLFITLPTVFPDNRILTRKRTVLIANIQLFLENSPSKVRSRHPYEQYLISLLC